MLRVRPWTTNRQGRRLYLDRTDHRAWQLSAARGVLDKPAVTMWRALVDRCQPDLVLDVGANYGEVLLSASYPPDCRVLAVEANPAVAAHLARSVQHAGSPAEVHAVAAGASVGWGDLIVDPRSSGLSMVDVTRSNASVGAVKVTPLDDLVGETEHRSLLFKIDVEGSEHLVIQGMERLLARSTWVGLVENNSSLQHSESPYIYAIRRDYLLERVSARELPTIGTDKSTFFKDVVLAADQLPERILPLEM